jgi:hypothetical protein
MSDQELAVQAISEAQHILEEYLEPRHHNNEMLLDRLVFALPSRTPWLLSCLQLRSLPGREQQQAILGPFFARIDRPHAWHRRVRGFCE